MPDFILRLGLAISFVGLVVLLSFIGHLGALLVSYVIYGATSLSIEGLVLTILAVAIAAAYKLIK